MVKLKLVSLVALSFFLFAAGYRLLAVQPAHAQSGTTIEGANLEPGWNATGVVDRIFYHIDANGGHRSYPTPIPGTESIVGTASVDFDHPTVLLGNGDVLQLTGTDWALVGNLFSGGAPTGVQRETWGRLKVRYR